MGSNPFAFAAAIPLNIVADVNIPLLITLFVCSTEVWGVEILILKVEALFKVSASIDPLKLEKSCRATKKRQKLEGNRFIVSESCDQANPMSLSVLAEQENPHLLGT